MTNIILFVLLVISFFIIFSLYKNLKSCKQSYTSENLIVQRQTEIIENYKEQTEINKDSIAHYKDLYEISMSSYYSSQKRLRRLEKEFGKLKDQMDSIVADSSYNFLMGVYQPEGELEYPFAGNQVKDMHLDFLERIKMEDIIEELKIGNQYLNSSLYASGDMIMKYSEQSDSCNAVVYELQEEIGKAAVADEKDQKKIRNYKILSSILVGALIVAIL